MSIIFLDHLDLNMEEQNALGGKALNLLLLRNAGFQVPHGFILKSEIKDLEVAIQKIGGFPVAVRSSGSLEDLEGASFAGLYETFLNINSYEELYLSIKKCFASLEAERVIDYIRVKGIDLNSNSLRMSVLVQKMISPRIAGVIFTLNPSNGFEEELYFEYCMGVGERLVSGIVTPSRCRYDWKEKKLISHDINSEGAYISDGELLKLAQASLEIQAYFGSPQDIEWAIDHKGELFILQSRPITTYTVREDFPEVTNADLKDGGISARACTPCMFSLYRNAFEPSMGDYFKKIKLIDTDEDVQWLFHAYGKVFWNAEAVKVGLKKIPGFNEEDFDRDLGVQKDYGDRGPYRTALSASSLIGAVPVLMGLNREFSDCEIMVEQFSSSFDLRDEEHKFKLSTLPSMEWADFQAWFLGVISFQFLTERNYFRTIYNNSNFQSEFKTYLKKLSNYQEGDELELMGHLDNIPHLDVQADLAKLTKVADFYGFFSQSYHLQREVFLKRHYHHGPAELDLLVPRWGENKVWVDDLVKAYSPTSLVHSNNFDQTKSRLKKNMGFFGRRSFDNFLKRSRTFLKIREEMRSFSTRAYYLVRLGLLEFAKRHDLSEKEVFMFDIDEIKLKLLDKNYSLPDIRSRLLNYDGYFKFKSPNEFGGSIKASQSSFKDGQLKGIGCSPGELTGKARVITDIHKTQDLEKGDILVTLFTDPGWTPVLARVGGVITEVGGLLSHAAVIGREYGIPAVLNLIDATKIIKDGDLVRINGKSGTVDILEKRS